MAETQLTVIVRRWSVGWLRVEVEGGGMAFRKTFAAHRYSKAIGYALGIAHAMRVSLRDRTGRLSDEECAELQAAFREAR